MNASRRDVLKGGSAAIAGLGILGSAGAAAATNTQSVVVYASDVTQVGEGAYITGSTDSLGNWETAYKMYPQSSYWKYEAELPVGTELKIVRHEWVDGVEISTDGVEWETGENHVVEDGQTILNLYPDF
jgi:hypothetical protein